MPEMKPIATDELTRCEERARRLAMEKSYLQLVNNLMLQLSEERSVESVVDKLLRLLLDNLGGSNVSLTYAIGADLYYADVYGKQTTIETIDDALVKRAFETREFIEEDHDFEQTKMLTPEFTRASTWATPLMIGNDLIGVLKLDDMLMAAAEIREQLEPFFRYAALVLRNEISGYAKLNQAYNELAEINASLSHEVGQRKQAEESLQKSHEQLQLKLDSLLMPEVEISGQELSNIIDAPAMQSLLEHFTELTGMTTAILDIKGTVLVATGWQEICTQFHRKHPDTVRFCTESDLYMTKTLQAGEHVGYKCKNGLWDVATPLLIGGKHLGNIYTGQFFYEDEPLDVQAFAAQAARHGFDQEPYMAALQRVPRFSRGTIKTLMKFLIRLSDVISRLSYSNLELSKALLANKRIAESLRLVNTELENRVEKRTLELMEANTKLHQELAERRRVDARLQITQFAVDSSADAIFWIRPDGSFSYWNKAACAVLGYASQEFLKLKTFDLNPEHQGATWDTHWQELRRQGFLRFETSLARRDGSRLPVEITANLIEVNGEEYNCGFVRDISERKKAEEQFTREAAVNAAMSELTKNILTAPSVREMAIEILEKARQLTSSQLGYVGYIDQATGFLVCPTMTHEIWDQCGVPGKSIVFDKFAGLFGWVLTNKKSLMANEPSLDSRSSGTPPGHIPITRFLSAPALHGDDLIGQIALANSGRLFTEEDIVVVERMADIFALGLRRKQAEENLVRLNEELEQRVTLRTEEIEKKKTELERMNKLFVGRELRMIELKEKIKELEAKRL